MTPFTDQLTVVTASGTYAVSCLVCSDGNAAAAVNSDLLPQSGGRHQRRF